MVEIFITDINTQSQSEDLLAILKRTFNGLQINFDLGETDLPFPQGHSVLRVEGEYVDSTNIITVVKAVGYKCEIMADTII